MRIDTRLGNRSLNNHPARNRKDPLQIVGETQTTAENVMDFFAAGISLIDKTTHLMNGG